MLDAAPRSYIVDALWQGALILALAVVLSFAVNHFRRDALPLVGDWSQKGRMQDVKTMEEPTVSLEEARALFLTQGAIFIDARPAESYMAGHIEGALNLPLEDFEAFFQQVVQQIQPESLLIVYCDGESCNLSHEVALQLSSRGFPHVRVLVNGWSVWKDAKLPAEQ